MLYDEPCTQGRLQVLDDGTLRVQAAFGRTVWRVSRALVTGLTTQPGTLGSLNVTVHLNVGSYQSKMVTQKNFAKLQALLSTIQPAQQQQQQSQPPLQGQPPYTPYGGSGPGPLPPPKKKNRRTLWIVVGVIIGLLLLVGIFSNGSTSSSQPDASSAPTPDPLAGARFGGQFAAFTAKYGQPQSVISNLAFIQNLQVDNDQGQVDNMLASVPKGQTWTMSEGESQCKAFYPADAVHVRHFPTADVDKLNDGVAMIYTSAALARVFPTSRFTDQQHHPTTAGTFTVAYNYLFSKSTNQWDSTHLLQYEFDLGIPNTLKTYTKAGGMPTPTSSSSGGQGNITQTHGAAVLRGKMSDFYGKYGSPDNINSADAFWNLNSDGSLFLQVRDDSGNGSVDFLSVTTPDGWSIQKIKDLCMQYAPDGYTLDPTSPPNTYNPIVYDSPGGTFAIHVQAAGLCQMNTIN